MGTPADHLRLIGFSPWSIDRIRHELLAGTSISRVPGDFVLTWTETINGVSTEYIATSIACCRPYFYYFSPEKKQFFHGANCFDLVRQSGLSWRWNQRALSCLLIAEHIAGNDSLHADIQMVPPASILTYCDGRLTITTDDCWKNMFDHPNMVQSCNEAIQTFNSIVGELPTENLVVSLSGGYDSRAILSSVLAQGVKPLVLTMGSPLSTDSVISKKISDTFKLDHIQVELNHEDFLRYAEDIVYITGGTKVPGHWHTYLYVLNAQLPTNAFHLVGSNGEFARTYYFDKGALALLANKLPITEFFFQLKFGRRKRPLALQALPIDDGYPFGEVPSYFNSLTDSHLSSLERLDQFYATQRVRHFISNGLALYNAVVPSYSPFLDCRWIYNIAALPRHFKLGNRYHRELIKSNCPALLDIIDESGRPAGRTAPPLYWLKKNKVVSYSPINKIINSETIDSMLIESLELRTLFDRDFIAKGVADSSLKGFLLTLHHVVCVLKRHQIAY